MELNYKKKIIKNIFFIFFIIRDDQVVFQDGIVFVEEKVEEVSLNLFDIVF